MVARLEPISPQSMSQAQQELYEVLTAGPRSKDPGFPLTNSDGSLQGPFNALLLSPTIGAALQEVGNALRHSSGLLPREREITILTVASYWECEFELATHERIGRELGLSTEELLSLRQGSVPDFAIGRETTCALVAQALTRVGGRISDSDWESWIPELGRSGVFELSSIVGYYSVLALQMRIFQVS